MKKTIGIASACILFVGLTLLAAEQPNGTSNEYVTIRWDGRDNTHLIRPGGKVEFIGPELRKFPKPSGADDRSFFMNAAMNGLAAQGFELAAMTEDDIVMRRRK